MRKISVVGEQHKTLGILIEPARREQSFSHKLGRDEVEHGPALPLFGGADHALRFIEHYIRSKNLQTALYYYLYTVSGLMNPTLDLDAEVKRLYDRVKDVMPEVDTLKLTDESIKAVEALLFKIEK